MTFQYGPEDEEDLIANNDDWLDHLEDDEDDEEVDFSEEDDSE